MTTVRFATTCDHCGQRSIEYTAWPTCRLCHADVCYQCAAPDTLIDADLDQPETVRCERCASLDEDLTGYDYCGGGR